MKRYFLFLIVILNLYGAEITGYYLSHQNDEGKRSVIEVFEYECEYYAYGFANTDGSVSVDAKNPNPKLKGRSMGGVVFLWGLKKDGDEWSKGKIYNYASGKTYDASAWFNKKGELVVKASVWGFGKKMIWKKLTEEEVKQYLDKKPTLESVLETIPKDKEN